MASRHSHRFSPAISWRWILIYRTPSDEDRDPSSDPLSSAFPSPRRYLSNHPLTSRHPSLPHILHLPASGSVLLQPFSVSSLNIRFRIFFPRPHLFHSCRSIIPYCCKPPFASVFQNNAMAVWVIAVDVLRYAAADLRLEFQRQAAAAQPAFVRQFPLNADPRADGWKYIAGSF